MNAANVAIWLIGNLSLAFFPVLLASGLARSLRRDLAGGGRVRWGRRLVALLLWLLFLPNTCYLLTEWRHYLNSVSLTPAFYPVYHRGLYSPQATLQLLALTVFYALYSGLGLLSLFLAVRPLRRLAGEYWNRDCLRLGQAAVFALCAVGVYMGLVNRFNSWDVLRLHTAIAILQTLTGLLARPILLLVLLAFAGFLWLACDVLDLCAEGLALRRNRPASLP